MGSETKCELGVADFSDENMKPGSKEWVSTCRVVRRGLEQHGCFIVLYDKVGQELCNSMISTMDQLFHLPSETKMQETSPKIFHGYYGQYSLLPLYESLGIDHPLTMEGIQNFAHIMWPQGNDRFCEIVKEYAKVAGEVDRLVYRMVFESYGLDQDRCDSFVESNNHLLRCFKYRKREIHEADLGIHAHTDMSLLTILHQLNFDG
ncbi:probable 2-oxoglutarate-dependent dioxygenase AOP1 [Neltuma alba]|uniref:probable 2-oxoglutarate-dependent dioxygenase AOP1 n=1 Tax=Neltuma alba TaxID=207710 RepID=UPI0010A4D71F|nr:probable 2-oxoglutarate-dependent dioxygenase AOP1 [Prosopis alba]